MATAKSKADDPSPIEIALLPAPAIIAPSPIAMDESPTVVLAPIAILLIVAVAPYPIATARNADAVEFIPIAIDPVPLDVVL